MRKYKAKARPVLGMVCQDCDRAKVTQFRPLFFKGNNDVLLITQGSKLCDFSSVTVLTDHTQHRSCLCFVFPHNLVSSLQLCWREPFVTLIHLTNITEAPQLCARHLLCVYYAPSTLLSTGHSVPSRSFLLLIPFRPFPGGGTQMGSSLKTVSSLSCSRLSLTKNFYFCKVLLHPLSHFIRRAPIQGKVERDYYSI